MKKTNSTKIRRFILIIVSVLTSCCGLAFLIMKTMTNGVSITSDAWLGFWGSIIGSIVTILGIMITFVYESKQSQNLRRLEAQPIITLKELPLGIDSSENEGSYNLYLNDSNKTGDNLHFVLPDIEIQNIGLNFATNIDFAFDFEFNNPYGVGMRGVSILDTKESKRISVSLDIPKNRIYSFFNDNSFEHKKGSLSHACIARTIAMLIASSRKESTKRVQKVSFVNGNITTTFDDIYGNTYMQEREAIIYFVELQDEPSFFYMSFPEFAEAKLVKKI